MYTGCSGTLRNMCADTKTLAPAEPRDAEPREAEPGRLAWMLAMYTPRSFTCSAECHGRVVDFVQSWILGAHCSNSLPAGFTPTWEALVITFAAHPRRPHLDALWRASGGSEAVNGANNGANNGACGGGAPGGEACGDPWRCGWLAVMRAADFWDVPCLYWHMVYLCHERGPPRSPRQSPAFHGCHPRPTQP